MRLTPPVDSLKPPELQKLPNFWAKKFNSDRKKLGSFSPKIREWKKLLNFFLQNSAEKLPSIKKKCPGNQKNAIFFRHRGEKCRIFWPGDPSWLSTPALVDSLQIPMAIHLGGRIGPGERPGEGGPERRAEYQMWHSSPSISGSRPATMPAAPSTASSR